MNAIAPLAATQRRARVRVPMLRPDPLLITALVAFFGLLFIAFFGERIAPNEQIYFVIEHGKDPRPYDPGLASIAWPTEPTTSTCCSSSVIRSRRARPTLIT